MKIYDNKSEYYYLMQSLITKNAILLLYKTFTNTSSRAMKKWIADSDSA